MQYTVEPLIRVLNLVIVTGKKYLHEPDLR